MKLICNLLVFTHKRPSGVTLYRGSAQLCSCWTST